VVHIHTGKSIEQIEKDFERDNWMTATEAKEYGLVDEVLVTNPRKTAAK
jgi:ATP-dependent Clp protease protease subunit